MATKRQKELTVEERLRCCLGLPTTTQVRRNDQHGFAVKAP